jgi:adenine-specific DNA-methyltransferase
MQNLFHEMEDLLRQRDEFFSQDGSLLRNLVIEKGLRLDQDLLSLLLSHNNIKQYFFTVVGEIHVFDKEKFLQFVNNKNFLPDSSATLTNEIVLSEDNGKTLLSQNRKVSLVWPDKDCVLQEGQINEENRKVEILWNPTLAPDDITRLLEPKVFTGWKRYDKYGSHEVNDLNQEDNLIIKGNNLLALHSLKGRFGGQVKLIYIDSTFNAGNDSFSYNEKYPHSTWLTFMKNRLEAAYPLLAPDGYILIKIDNREVHYLKVLCDEIFRRENFRNGIIVNKGTKSIQKQSEKIFQLNAGYDTILLYSKSKDSCMPNLVKELGYKKTSSWNNHWVGTARPTMKYELLGKKTRTGRWRWSEERSTQAVENYNKLITFIKEIEGNIDVSDALIDKYYWLYMNRNDILDVKDFELIRLSSQGNPEHYIPSDRKMLLNENWLDISNAGRIDNFEQKMNEEIMFRILDWLTEENDLVLDFFLGSGTTAAVSHKLKRQYIGIEQMDYGEDGATRRLIGVIEGERREVSTFVDWKGGGSWIGGGSFVYCEMCKINSYFFERINKATTKDELLKIYDDMGNRGYIEYRFNMSKFDERLDQFMNLPINQQKELLINILDTNEIYVNLSEIEDVDYKISAKDITLNEIFYQQKIRN